MKRTPLRRKTRLRAVSPKRAAADAVLADARDARRRMAGDWCEGGTPACRPGAHRGHHAHHVQRRAQGVDHSVDNLRWLCVEGHDWVHRNVADAKALGLLA